MKKLSVVNTAPGVVLNTVAPVMPQFKISKEQPLYQELRLIQLISVTRKLNKILPNFWEKW